MTAIPPERSSRSAILLDPMVRGCREARTAVPSDEDPARYVMARLPGDVGRCSPPPSRLLALIRSGIWAHGRPYHTCHAAR